MNHKKKYLVLFVVFSLFLFFFSVKNIYANSVYCNEYEITECNLGYGQTGCDFSNIVDSNVGGWCYSSSCPSSDYTVTCGQPSNTGYSCRDGTGALNTCLFGTGVCTCLPPSIGGGGTCTDTTDACYGMSSCCGTTGGGSGSTGVCNSDPFDSSGYPANCCTTGTATAPADSGSGWSWKCNDTPCSTFYPNPSCGGANGTPVSSAPSSNLCSAGAASSVTGSGPWNWTCNYSTVNRSTSCSAPVATQTSCNHVSIGASVSPASINAGDNYTLTCTFPSGTYIDTPCTYTGGSGGTANYSCPSSVTNPYCTANPSSSQLTNICADSASTSAPTIITQSNMSGTLVVPSCTILSGNSNCEVTLSWSTTNPVATSSVTSTYPSSGTVVGSGNYGSTSATIPYSSRAFYLYNNSVLLDQGTASATCASGTSWNGTICTHTCQSGYSWNGTACVNVPIDGGWSDWSPNASCPTVCGQSASTLSRSCTNPTPANGGADCVGSTTLSCAATSSCAGGMSGTLTPATSSCNITAGTNSCPINFTWTTTNPALTSAVTSDTNNTGTSAPNTNVANGNNSVSPTPFTIPYPGRNFYLYNSGVLLAQRTSFSNPVTAVCTSGTVWNGSICVTASTCQDSSANNFGGSLPCTYSGGGVSITADKLTIAPGDSTTLRWNNGTGSCTGTNFTNSGGSTSTSSVSLSGNTTISPTITTTYTFACTNGTAAVTVKVRKKPIFIEQ